MILLLLPKYFLVLIISSKDSIKQFMIKHEQVNQLIHILEPNKRSSLLFQYLTFHNGKCYISQVLRSIHWSETVKPVGDREQLHWMTCRFPWTHSFRHESTVDSLVVFTTWLSSMPYNCETFKTAEISTKYQTTFTCFEYIYFPQTLWRINYWEVYT